MSAILTATISGEQRHVDLSRVTARDAIEYRQAVGEDIDARVAAWLDLAGSDDGLVLPLADRGIFTWLAARQAVVDGQRPLMDLPLSVAAESVALLVEDAELAESSEAG